MGNALADLAVAYARTYGAAVQSHERLKQLYDRRINSRETVFELTPERSAGRDIKPLAAGAVGGVMNLVGAGAVSLPAAFATRIAFDRYRTQVGLSERLSADIESLRAIVPA